MSDPGDPKPTGDAQERGAAAPPPNPAPDRPGASGPPAATGARPAQPTSPRPPANVPGASGAGTGRPGGGGAPPQARPAQAPRPRPEPEPFVDEEPDEWDERSSRLARAMGTLGIGLIAVLTTQVLSAILEGLAARASQLEPNGIETDLLHRLGFPFGSLGAPALLFLVVGIGLLAIPIILREETTSFYDRMVTIALVVTIAIALIIAAGSLLAVRYQLYQFTSQGVDPPPYARLGFGVYLLGALGTAAVAVSGVMATFNARKRTES